ncbi:GNAT family N-acetyltransferase [Taibaiella sp. KBW10]|uniref:GNAT family N-acetyltransferase n=1 Tax=Taibaiella sp. KBW10 TaxID=2153357 RepID=UPI000F58F2DF|nr:GNAT family N-acetyltransferase [Taibaiella sp. KBW10]RQO30298.1 GNAT family N-acetyltransferase [Taibaiella sp. KBW10]
MNIFATTERLILRTLLPTDIEGLFALDSDPEVHRYLGNKPTTTKEAAGAAIEFIRKQYLDNGIGRWAVIDKHTNDFIGWAGLKLVKEETNKHIDYYDLGYRLRKEYWGKGIATEAAKACLSYAFDTLNARVVYAIADCENTGSDKVLKKSGLRFIETFDLDGTPHHWYRIGKDEFMQG